MQETGLGIGAGTSTGVLHELRKPHLSLCEPLGKTGAGEVAVACKGESFLCLLRRGVGHPQPGKNPAREDRALPPLSLWKLSTLPTPLHTLVPLTLLSLPPSPAPLPHPFPCVFMSLAFFIMSMNSGDFTNRG